jgi:hypothetical protein
MWNRRCLVLLVATSLAALTAGAAAAGATAGAAASPATRPAAAASSVDRSHDWDRAGTRGQRGTGVSGLQKFIGQDGGVYDPSPLAVNGGNGVVFFGEDFDAACAFGEEFDKGLKRIARLVDVIAGSGRRVVFSVAPNKTAVDKAALAGAVLPHGRCDARGIRQQDHTLDTFRNDNWIPMRAKLAGKAAIGVDEYWKVDTHWTSVGTTTWAQDIALRLSPKLAQRQSYRRDTELLRVNLSFLGIVGEIVESSWGRATTTKVKVKPKPSMGVFDPENVSPTVGWRAAPRKRTWPGHTLLLGDSFAYRAMDPLMHMFRHGEFLWLGLVPAPDLVDAIAAADTVVIEVVQRYVPGSILGMKSMLEEVRQALRHHHHR